MICTYCSKEFVNKIGFSNHVIRCPKNPNRKLQVLTEDGRKRISEKISKNNLERNKDPNFKEKHRLAMQRAVKNNPESYTSSNRGRTKQVEVDGVKLQGSWEKDFFIWAKNAGLDPIRPTEGFNYFWEKNRVYFPDFYIKSKDLYVEVKGYETEKDRAKWRQFPKKLIVLKEKEIKQIRNNSFEGL